MVEPRTCLQSQHLPRGETSMTLAEGRPEEGDNLADGWLGLPRAWSRSRDAFHCSRMFSEERERRTLCTSFEIKTNDKSIARWSRYTKEVAGMGWWQGPARSTA
jgi:hypothetical protein